MARWPVCVELPPGLGAELASWPDDPEILHDAIERLRAARSALARELGAGVRARRGDASERAAWSSLLERAPEARPAERAGARAAGFASTRAPLAPGVDASSDAAASSDADRRRADSAAPTRTPRDSSGGTYRRLASSQLRGMYSLSASAEFRAAEAAARSAGERVERSVSDADADADAAEKVADTPVAETRSRRDVRERSDSIGTVAVDAVPSVSPETRMAEKGAERIKSSEEKMKTRLSAGSAPRVFRLRIRDVENVSALVVAENLASRSREASCSFGDHSGDVTRVFLCAATRTKKEAPFRSGKRHPEDDGVERHESSRACFLLHATTRLNASKRGTGDDVSSDVSSAARMRKQKSHPDPGDFETDLETVARRVSVPKRKREEPSFAFGDDAKHPWVAHVAESVPDFDPRSRREKDVNRGVHSVGVRVFPLNGSSSPGAFLATPFAPTKVAASRGGGWLVACGARGVCALWRGDDVREALRRGAERSAEGTGYDGASENDDFPPVLLAAPRYGGVAPRGDAPDVLAFADDGKTLFAAHDGALFATWTLTEEGKELSRDETNEDETNRLKSLETRGGCSSWRPRGVSYSTRETVCDGAAHVFGEASDEEATPRRDDPDRVPRRTGFAFKSGAFARNTRDRPSLLVALARAKPEERLSNDTSCDVSRARLAVGLLDHTAGRGEAHRGAVFGGASFFETKDAFDEENDEETARGSGLGETRRFGSEFDPVALAGARGGYAAVVGADGAVYVWDVVTGETLDAWYVDAAADEKAPRDDIRVAIASATGFVQTECAHLTVAVAFESGDDVVVETRRVRLPAEDKRGKRRRVS